MTPTPTEQAKAVLEAAEQARLVAHHAAHDKREERSRAMSDGISSTAQIDELGNQLAKLSTAQNFAEAALVEAREQVRVAYGQLVAARNKVAGLRNEAGGHGERHRYFQEQADSQQQLRDVALAALSRAEQALAVIEPPEQAAQPIAAPEPSPVAPELRYPLPVRTVNSNPPRSYDGNDVQVGPFGEPLA